MRRKRNPRLLLTVLQHQYLLRVLSTVLAMKIGSLPRVPQGRTLCPALVAGGRGVISVRTATPPQRGGGFVLYNYRGLTQEVLMRPLETMATARNVPLTELFREGWVMVYQKPCASNRVILDSARYVATGILPPYMGSYLRLNRKDPPLPPQASYSEAYHKFQVTDHFILVDPEPGSLMTARRCRDGVFRCR